jgi:hypothetical protein
MTPSGRARPCARAARRSRPCCADSTSSGRAVGHTVIRRQAEGEGGGTAVAALTAGELGFFDQGYQRLVAQGVALRIAAHLLPLAIPPASLEASERFVVGLVSPITGHYSLD